MLRSFAGLVLASVVLSAPALAQGRETEFGADIAFKWIKPSGGTGMLHVQTPVDFRVAFHTGAIAIEPRITGEFVTASGDNLYIIDPGVNLLFALGGGARTNGSYATVGADLMVAGGTGMDSESAVSLNAGFGMRRPMGKAATRAEIFVGYTPKQSNAVQTTTIGLRLGVSFFN